MTLSSPALTAKKIPLVSVIVPCYNEAGSIRLLLEAIERQTYPHERLEVVIADGQSTDATRQEIAAFQASTPGLTIRVVDNVRRIIPAGLNRAIEEASGEIIVRLDAHSMPYPDYIARCVSWLEKESGPFNIGGVWEIRPSRNTLAGRGIAAAAAHPLGAGDALYRISAASPRPADTVPFGAFRKELVQQVGGFDESLQTNEDYEFNVRVRRSGGRVWLDPGIRSIYFARPTLSSLARQYWRYGWWKARMLKRYPDTLRWRQTLPPLLVTGMAGLLLLGLFLQLARWVFLASAGAYVLALLAAGVQAAFKKKDPGLLISLPAAVAVMHFSWGAGFLVSVVRTLSRAHTQRQAASRQV
jgi:glycosyltransferase involved in cell wall biosynthesis